MEVVLDKQDIEDLIKKCYPVAESIVFNFSEKNFKVVMKVSQLPNLNVPNTSHAQPAQTKPRPPPKPLTADEKFRQEAKKGAMASGGSRRLLSSM